MLMSSTAKLEVNTYDSVQYRIRHPFFYFCFDINLSFQFFPNKEDSEHCKARSILFLDWLNKRPEKCIAVVTHSSFLRHLFSQVYIRNLLLSLSRPANISKYF